MPAWRVFDFALADARAPDSMQPYFNQDGMVRYAADIGSVRRRQKCCKTAELPDMPVRNATEDVELTRRRSLVRTQHRPLINYLEMAVF
jgi:hypothetical protein